MRTDDRIPTLRWTKVDSRRKRHLWLGRATACGIELGVDCHTLEAAYPDPACGKCWTYAQGWLDRHDHGDNPPLHVSPRGAHTRLPVTP